jgi:phage host-nuclease inhibitor protein Gam
MGKERIKADFKLTAMGCDNLEKADSLLRQIGDLQLQIHDEEAICKSAIDAASTAMQEAVRPLQERIALYTQAIEGFANANPDVFGKNRSIKLQHGKMGWRISSAVTIGANTIKLIKKKFKDRLSVFIKTTESVNKKALKSLSGKELLELEVFTTTTESFFVESNIPEAVDYKQAE